MKNIYRKVRLIKDYVESKARSGGHRACFDQVETYCMFFGYPRSGHTLIGSLLDAHPDIIVANELHALRNIRYNFNRDQLFYLLLKNSRDFNARGNFHTGYSYAVPNQWAGRFRKLLVIGDKRGPGSLKKLQAHPQLLERLRAVVGIRMRFIHTIRNPFDNISTIYTKGRGKTMKESIEYYFFLADTCTHFKKSLAADELFEIRLEDLVNNPAAELKNLCDFLGVAATEDYLRDCAGIVFQSPKQTRQNAPWTPERIRSVTERLQHYPFLANYTYDA